MEHKEVYSRVLDIHKHIFEQLKFAETKNNILLAFVVALILACFRVLQNNNSNTFFYYIILFALFVLAISAAFILSSFKPNLSNEEVRPDFITYVLDYFRKKQDNQDKSCNLYFFGDLAKIDSKELMEIIIKDFKDEEKEQIQNDKYIQDLLNQICVLSLITLNKHKRFQGAFNYIIFLFISFFVLNIFIFEKIFKIL